MSSSLILLISIRVAMSSAHYDSGYDVRCFIFYLQISHDAHADRESHKLFRFTRLSFGDEVKNAEQGAMWPQTAAIC